ncbi:MAG TPA: hypothetical protein VGM29_11365 [Polyangiaceae bacterium]|jgi:hypothetical protein
MKIKIVVVDFELPTRAKKWILRLGIPVAVLLGSGAVARAVVPKTWAAGDPLTAADLNGNFNDLDARIAKLEAATPSKASGFRAWSSKTAPVKNDGQFVSYPFDRPTPARFTSWSVIS